MLEQMLEVAYEEQQRDEARQQMVDAFMNFPEAELRKIASGEVKLGFYDGDGDWLGKFKGTPFYDQALALEEQKLKLDIADQQSRRQEREGRDSLWDARDAICLQKRMLELQLRKSEGGGEEGAAMPPPAPGDAPSAGPELPPGPADASVEKMSSVDYFYGLRQRALTKVGHALREKRAYYGGYGGGYYAPPPPTRAESAQEYEAYLGMHPDLSPEEVASKYRAKGQLGGAVGGGLLGGLTGAQLGILPGMLAQGGRGHGGLMAAGGLAGLALGGAGGAALGHYLGGREADKDVGFYRARSKRKEQKARATSSEGLSQIAEAIKGTKQASVNVADIWGREMAKQAMVKVAHSALIKVASERLEDMDGLEWHSIGEMAKAAEARMESGVAFEDLLDFEKVALLGTIMGGLKAGAQGAGKFFGQAGKAVGSSYSRAAGAAGGGLGGVKAGLVAGAKRARDWAGTGLQKATQWGAANPAAAAAAGGGALLGAAALGRASKRNQPQVVVQR